MKKPLVAWSVGWVVGFALIGVGGRALWFGLTPGTGIADITAAVGTALGYMLSGLAVGLAANGFVAATSDSRTSR